VQKGTKYGSKKGVSKYRELMEYALGYFIEFERRLSNELITAEYRVGSWALGTA
jgi:hypothetical protein